jgi:hypothetical protein
MPNGLQGQKRPADVIGNAVHVMQIATGETELRSEVFRVCMGLMCRQLFALGDKPKNFLAFNVVV